MVAPDIPIFGPWDAKAASQISICKVIVIDRIDFWQNVVTISVVTFADVKKDRFNLIRHHQSRVKYL
jgi:hypothetical protein